MPLPRLVALALTALGATTPVAPTPAWRAVAPGVEHLHLAEGDTELLRFDLARYRADVLVPGAARPQTAAQLRTARKAVLAINGGFFDTGGRPLGLRISAGKTVLGLRPNVDWGVLVLERERAAIVHSRQYAPGRPVQAALQVGPRILVDGQPTRLKPQVARRTAVALDPGGRHLTVVVTRRAVEAGTLARALAALGFEAALMLDGGPSTQLSAAVGDLKLEIEGGYPVPDGLVIVPR